MSYQPQMFVSAQQCERASVFDVDCIALFDHITMHKISITLLKRSQRRRRIYGSVSYRDVGRNTCHRARQAKYLDDVGVINPDR